MTGLPAPARLLAAALLVLVVGLSGYRAAYGGFPFAGPPERLGWCGRTYIAANPQMSYAEIEAMPVALPGNASYPLTQITLGWPRSDAVAVAAVTPEARRAALGVPCAMELYIKTDGDRYIPYTLSGGP